MTSIAADVASRAANDVTRALVQVDTDNAPAAPPALDADRIRAEIVEAACAAIASSLPALVEAARAGSTSEVVRDREGRIKRVETKFDR